MRVRYTPRALNDLDVIYRYLDQHSPAGARAVKASIKRRVRLLADFPFIAPATDEPGVYELSIIRYSYAIYYRIESEEVWIVHIRHTSRRRPQLDQL